MRVLMSGGGTAGHVYPALALAAALRDGERDDVLFVGTSGGAEARLVPAAGLRLVTLPARGYDRARPWTLVTSSVLLALSGLRALALLGRFRPDVVVGFGGYVSIPVGLAAVLLRVPLVLHEQNSVPGLANRRLSRFARSVAVTYPVSAERLARPDAVVVTGNPVRSEVVRATREAGRAAFGVAEDETFLVVFGGSRGARHINEAMVALRPRLAEVPRLRVLHAAGRIDAASVRERIRAAGTGADDAYRVEDYVEEMGPALAASDLVVSRAGATSIAEITAVGRAAVLVPYPYATDDHQTTNARDVERAGGAVLVPDAELDGPRFGDVVLRLLRNGDERRRMALAAASLGRPDAAELLARVIREAAHGSPSAEGDK